MSLVTSIQNLDSNHASPRAFDRHQLTDLQDEVARMRIDMIKQINDLENRLSELELESLNQLTEMQCQLFNCELENHKLKIKIDQSKTLTRNILVFIMALIIVMY